MTAAGVARQPRGPYASTIQANRARVAEMITNVLRDHGTVEEVDVNGFPVIRWYVGPARFTVTVDPWVTTGGAKDPKITLHAMTAGLLNSPTVIRAFPSYHDLDVIADCAMRLTAMMVSAEFLAALDGSRKAAQGGRKAKK